MIVLISFAYLLEIVPISNMKSDVINESISSSPNTMQFQHGVKFWVLIMISSVLIRFDQRCNVDTMEIDDNMVILVGVDSTPFSGEMCGSTTSKFPCFGIDFTEGTHLQIFYNWISFVPMYLRNKILVACLDEQSCMILK